MAEVNLWGFDLWLETGEPFWKGKPAAEMKSFI